jgi:hypothetical protein
MKQLIALTWILFGGSLSLALACSCLPAPSPKEAFAKADAVFSGTVESIQQHETRERLMNVTLRVLRSWKGTNAETLVVHTPSDEAMCGYSFSKREQYLVYARLSGGSATNRAALATGLCSRTSRLVNATEDLRFLGTVRK